jgi:tripartite-type tricarboxylate transporter receptor subunit TctC
MRRLIATSTAVVLCLSAGGPAATGDPVAEFYKGRTLQFLVGFSPGGEYDLHTRLIARHIGRHIPGGAQVVAQNMPGATGITMVNYIYNVAPKDGTVLGMIVNAMPAQQAVGIGQMKFDIGRFQWIGSIAPTVETMALWHTTGVTDIAGARQKEVPIGTVGRTGITFAFPKMLNDMAGTRFRIVTGYPGGNDINLAMERGEVGGRNNTWSAWKATRREWLARKDIAIIAYGGPKPSDLPGVPGIEDLVSGEDDRRTARLVLSGTQLGRPVAVMPGVPAERVAALRAAFLAAMRDPEFLKEAAASNVEVAPVVGEEMQRVVAEVLSASPEVKARARPLLE